ncbi:MAG: hypothetical protein LDL33_00590 [Desulfomonile sp.]|nr:hypothetical protein [Desulfomonile sp.]
MSNGTQAPVSLPGLPKCPTGIDGFDELAGGGLPLRRPTLVCGGPGSGKTAFALEFIVRGVHRYGESGVFVSFDESPDELQENARSFGFDLAALAAERKILLDHVHIERSEIEESGEYNLDGLFISLGYTIDSIGAKRVVLDGVDAIISSYSNDLIIRTQLRRLFRWVKSKGVTAVITAEAGIDTLTRLGFVEYVADCVISLDNRVNRESATRLLRIVKYRGSAHESGEVPFLIREKGLSVLSPNTSESGER